jgi:hypothetical protein
MLNGWRILVRKAVDDSHRRRIHDSINYSREHVESEMAQILISGVKQFFAMNAAWHNNALPAFSDL